MVTKSESPKVMASLLLERMTPEEVTRAQRVEAILPVLKEAAREADAKGAFPLSHVKLLRDAGLLGLIVPTEYGGLGGTLRDLAGATFAMGSVCPSTALSYFFHCSSASRGLLALEALDAGLFTPDEAPIVRSFATRLLRKMGEQGMWLANFASETVKTASSAVTITTEATKVDGGYRLDGVKSFGCSTGVADEYVVTAKLKGSTDASGLALFCVRRESPGVRERSHWDALGMRATETHGIVLDNVRVPEEDALAIPGAFVRMMQMSRGSFVGNQLAATAAYLGGAQGLYDHIIGWLTSQKFEDTGRPLGESPMHQELVGRMTVDLETGYLWLRRQLELETSNPPLRPKDEVVRQWRMCKGEVTEAAFRVAMGALKSGGTGQTANGGALARGLRDLAMGLVQAFPAERGRLEVAKMVISSKQQALFGVNAEGHGSTSGSAS